MSKPVIEVQIRGLAATSGGCAVFLGNEEKVFVMLVDQSVGAAIAMFKQGTKKERPTYLRFRYGGSFGLTDPIFGVDLGFYVFRLPWYELLQGSLLSLTVWRLRSSWPNTCTLGFSRLTGSLTMEVAKPAVQHLSILLFILAGSFGWGYYLDRFDLLYSTTGVVYGVGYTAAHVTLLGTVGDDCRLGGGVRASRI